jgi:hypothetical protein
MQGTSVSAYSAVALLFVLSASAACWAWLGATTMAVMRAWSGG